MAFAAATHSRDLTDEQWDLIGRFLPNVRRADGRGRPRRENGRFQQWVRVGVLRSILEILAQALHDQGYLDLQEAFIGGSFAAAKQGDACVGKTKRGKGSKIVAIAECQGDATPGQQPHKRRA
jgi:hypothetical protein